VRRATICLHLLAVLLLAGCTGPPPPAVEAPVQQATQASRQIEVAFSPEAGAEALVVKVIASAGTSSGESDSGGGVCRH